ncbi:MAG: M24B family metallopeptidase, partial [Myxococcota bacterium]
ALLEQAVAATAAGHRRAMAVARPGVTEADLEAVLGFEFRRHGAARHGYEPIVAAGENACILHYIENCDELRAQELVLIDAGAEVGMYTGDVTRTFPVGGFTSCQRALYDVVLRANEEAIAMTKPGVSLRDIDARARLVLAEGLVSLGLLQGDPEELALKRPFDGMPEGHPGKAPLDRFYMHGTSHWLGSDVHDVGAYHDGKAPLCLAPGMVFTIEPGLYVPRDAHDLPEGYRGVGIRIEDNILVTHDGHRNLTAMIPKHPDALESLVGSERL